MRSIKKKRKIARLSK